MSRLYQKSFEFFEGKSIEFSINLSISDILEKEVVDFWTHWQKRILTNGQFGYITLDE